MWRGVSLEWFDSTEPYPIAYSHAGGTVSGG